MGLDFAVPPEIVALIDKPLLLAAILAVGAFFGMFIERFVERSEREKRKAHFRGRMDGGGKVTSFRKEKVAIPLKGTPARAALDASEQLRCVMEAGFTARALLNRPEAAVFKALDAAVIARNPNWQVMAQVSLGEFLASDDKDAYFAVNSKRVDFAPLAA